MVFADVTIALPLLCQGLLERYGEEHVRPARAAIAASAPLDPGAVGSLRSAQNVWPSSTPTTTASAISPAASA